MPYTHVLPPAKQTCCCSATHAILSASGTLQELSLGLSCSGTRASMPGILSAVACPLFSMASLSSCCRSPHRLPRLEAFAEPFLSCGPCAHLPVSCVVAGCPQNCAGAPRGSQAFVCLHPEHLTMSVCAGSLRTAEPQPASPFSHGLVRQILAH